VNDTGAIAYLSGRRTFDVVGLTTAGEAGYWTSGAGSRFEHYERTDRAKLPTHFIVYPEWLRADPLLGEWLTERAVPGATILGGERMVAYVAVYDALGSARLPRNPPEGRERSVLDELDVADLESEAAHRFEIVSGSQWTNVVIGDRLIADGGRSERTRDLFELEVAPGGTLVARVGSDAPTRLSVRIDGGAVGELVLSGSEWEEPRIRIPPQIARGRRSIDVRAEGGATFTSMAYWSFGG
jgi:hypothetical protein